MSEMPFVLSPHHLIEFSTRLRSLQGQILKPLEKSFLEPYRKRGKIDPLTAPGSRAELLDGAFATYALASFATLDLLSLFGASELRATAVVVPSLKLHLGQLQHESEPVLLSRQRRRLHIVGLPGSSYWGTDCYTPKDASARLIDAAQTEFKQHGNIRESFQRVIEDNLQTRRDLRGRVHLLTDDTFLGGKAEAVGSFFSTASYFTQLPAGETLLFHKDENAALNGASGTSILLAESLADATKAAKAQLEERLEELGVLPEEVADEDRTDLKSLLAGLEPYVSWVRVALGVKGCNATELSAVRSLSVESLPDELPTGTHQLMVAASCFDPLIGASDGTHVIHLDGEPPSGFLDALHELVVPILTRFGRFDQALYNYRRLRSHALRATVSGILARSMAHDIGSHMLAKMEFQTSVKEEAEELDCLREYLRVRMVWIAEATTSEPSWSMPLRLKSDVLDPFEKLDSGNVTPMLRYLAKDREIDKVSFELHGDGDLPIAFPTGVVGAHAVYALLENVIRNAAKYRDDGNGGELVCHLRLCDSVGDQFLVRLRVWDDRSRYRKKKFEEIQRCCAPISSENAGEHAKDEAVYWPFVDASGERFPRGGGIKEMRVAAAWLRGEPLQGALQAEESPGSGSERPPLLRPIIVDGSGEEREPTAAGCDDLFMGYELFVRRPTLLSVISEGLASKLGNDAMVRFESKGIHVAAELDPEIAASFETMVIDLGDDTDLLDQLTSHRNQLPVRLLVRGKTQGLLPLCSDIEESVLGSIDEDLEESRFFSLCLLDAEKRWLRDVLKVDPEESRTLLVNLLPKGADGASTSDREECAQWQSAAKELSDRLAPWQVCVPDTFDAMKSLCEGARHLAVVRHHEAPFHSDPPIETVSDWKYSRASTIDSLLRSPPAESAEQVRLLWRLFEAMAIGVYIIDERLGPELQAEGNRKLMLRLESMGVRFPGFNYASPSTSSLESLAATLKFGEKQTAADAQAPSPFVLFVHRGLLEERIGPEELAERINELREGAPLVVFTSDRGADSDRLPPGTRFVPFSALEAAVRAEDKLQLVTLAMNSRVPRRHDD